MRVACIWFEKSVATSKIADSFLRFSPQICLRQDRAIFVEIGKCRRLYSEESFLARAQVLLNRHNVAGRIALGSDLTDSLVLAKFNKSTVDELPLEALLEFCDPFNRDEAVRKAVLKMVMSFRDLGIKNLEQFKKLPANELISRFGVIGRHCHSRVHNSDFLVWPLWTPEEVIEENTSFPYFEFYGELEPILFELKGHLDRIFSRLYARNKRATEMRLEIRCEKVSTNPNPTREFIFKFSAPQSSAKGALRILKERLARDFEKESIISPIESFHTKVLKTAEASARQKNLFNNEEEVFEQISSLHNQLIEMVGEENVYQVELTEDRRPERSWRKKKDRPHEKSGSDIPLDQLPDQATYICRQPIKMDFTAGWGHIKNKRFRVVNWDNNVNRITGGCFERAIAEIKDSYDRNYFEVELEGNRKILVFETPGRQFYLHGYYG